MKLRIVHFPLYHCCAAVHLLFRRATGLRVEWAKSRARGERWTEEVLQVEEEMRRVLWFLEWKATWWDGQSHLQCDTSPELREGLSAYAAKQSSLLREMSVAFARDWAPVLAAFGMTTEDWPPRVRLHCMDTSATLTDIVAPSVEEEEEDDFDDDMFL